MVSRDSAIAVYVMASGDNGTLYVGVTSALEQRVSQHKQGSFEGFSKRYGCTRLVWFEMFGATEPAIRREKALKRWNPAWKLKLINEANPDWCDLSDG
jgi:putative endonuclease